MELKNINTTEVIDIEELDSSSSEDTTSRVGWYSMIHDFKSPEYFKSVSLKSPVDVQQLIPLAFIEKIKSLSTSQAGAMLSENLAYTQSLACSQYHALGDFCSKEIWTLFTTLMTAMSARLVLRNLLRNTALVVPHRLAHVIPVFFFGKTLRSMMRCGLTSAFLASQFIKTLWFIYHQRFRSDFLLQKLLASCFDNRTCSSMLSHSVSDLFGVSVPEKVCMN